MYFTNPVLVATKSISISAGCLQDICIMKSQICFAYSNLNFNDEVYQL